MRNISRRINTIEKQLSLGQHEKQIQPLLIICAPTNSTSKDIEKLGPVETWITYQEQLQAQKKANAKLLKDNPNSIGATIIIKTDAEKEYQARATKSNQKQLKAAKGQGNE